MSADTSRPRSDGSKVLFFDDFGQGFLDRSRWNVRTTGPVFNTEQQAYLDSPETIDVVSAQEAPGVETGGALVLHARHHPGFVSPEGDRFDFISGKIDTRDRFAFLYGTAEARMRLPAGPGFWPAFWALGMGKWPETGEIDIMENTGEPGWVSAAVHGPGYSGDNGLVHSHSLPADQDATAWHVYAVEWSPVGMRFLLDGRDVYRIDPATIARHGAWVFDQEKYLILNLALGGIYPFRCNGVRSPYFGLPAQSVETIKAGQGRVMVDWVRVTRLPEMGNRNAAERSD